MTTPDTAPLPAEQTGNPGQPRHAAEPAVNWDDVRAIRRAVADRLATAYQEAAPASEDDRRHYGRALIQYEVGQWVTSLVTAGRTAPSQAEEDQLRQAVYASVFGLGRLQPLVDDPDVENIEISGCDNVCLSYADGRLVRGPAVADSDEELVAELQFLASAKGRALSTAKPRLHLQLPDGSRLAAVIETARRPQVVIRRHRLIRITLDDLIHAGTLSSSLAQFLGAAVRARRNIVVTGTQNAGKTTLIRALAGQIPAEERFATIEKEGELHLDRLGAHPRMVAFEAREGTSELAADGRPAGEVGPAELILDALRLNLRRIIVGEVRGDEVRPMLDAMTTGDGGSMCTLHARSAHDAVERMVTLCGIAGIRPQLAYRVVAGAVDLIVHLRLVDHGHGRRARFVSQVVEVGPFGERGRPAVTDLYVPGPDGRAVPTQNPPSCMDELEQVGFDRGWLVAANGGWEMPPPQASR